ncbi:MAG: hypothetical protein WBA47_12790, partial [Rhodanobacter sp.]
MHLTGVGVGGPAQPRVDLAARQTYHSAIMSVTLPESVDAWRMVSARRSFEGTLPIASLRRL